MSITMEGMKVRPAHNAHNGSFCTLEEEEEEERIFGFLCYQVGGGLQFFFWLTGLGGK